MLHIVVAAGQKIPQTGKQKPKVQLKFNYIKVAAPVAVHPHTPDIYIYIYIHIAITFNKFSIWVCHFLPPSPLRWHFSMGDQQMDAANYGCKKSNGGVEQKMVNATHSRTQNGVVGGRTTGPWVSMACRKLRSFTANAANWNNLHVVHVLAGGCNVNASHQRVKLACNPGVLARLLIPGFSSNHEFWFSPSDRRVCCRNSEQKKKNVSLQQQRGDKPRVSMSCESCQSCQSWKPFGDGERGLWRVCRALVADFFTPLADNMLHLSCHSRLIPCYEFHLINIFQRMCHKNKLLCIHKERLKIRKSKT